MAFSRVVFPLLVLSVINCYASNVPTIIWGAGESLKGAVQSNPLTTYSSTELSALIDKEIANDRRIIVFVEETLSVEDFSFKNEIGETLFPYLHKNIKEAIYLPAVADAVPALNRSAQLSEGSYEFINLNDAFDGETRADMLSRHDKFIRKTLEDLPEDEKYLALYTANNPSWTIPASKTRVRRAVEANKRNSRVYTVDGLRFVATNINVKSGNDSRSLVDVTAQSSVINGTEVKATLTFDNTTLTLNFYSKAGYWFFDTVDLTLGELVETLYSDDELYALLGFSYRCSQFVSFTSRNETKTYTLSFEDLKIQPFFETNTTQEFGDSFYCVGFFSAPIWAGLFVVFILLSITFYGIMMMMDIRTMDRFDDPKGKTITINAE